MAGPAPRSEGRGLHVAALAALLLLRGPLAPTGLPYPAEEDGEAHTFL